jgi:hypothetical protein
MTYEYEDGYSKGYNSAFFEIRKAVENIDLDDPINQQLSAIGFKTLILKILDKSY